MAAMPYLTESHVSKYGERVQSQGVWWTKWFWKQIGLTNRPTSAFPRTLALHLCSTSACHPSPATVPRDSAPLCSSNWIVVHCIYRCACQL